MYNYIDEVPEYLQEQADAYFEYVDEVLPQMIAEKEAIRLEEEALMDELAWYIHARQMGWE